MIWLSRGYRGERFRPENRRLTSDRRAPWASPSGRWRRPGRSSTPTAGPRRRQSGARRDRHHAPRGRRDRGGGGLPWMKLYAAAARRIAPMSFARPPSLLLRPSRCLCAGPSRRPAFGPRRSDRPSARPARQSAGPPSISHQSSLRTSCGITAGDHPYPFRPFAAPSLTPPTSPIQRASHAISGVDIRPGNISEYEGGTGAR